MKLYWSYLVCAVTLHYHITINRVFVHFVSLCDARFNSTLTWHKTYLLLSFNPHPDKRALIFLTAFDLLPSSTTILLEVHAKNIFLFACSLALLFSAPTLLPSSSIPLSFPLSLIVVFAQGGKKSAYPTRMDVCQSRTKFKLLGKAQLYLYHQQQTWVSACALSVQYVRAYSLTHVCARHMYGVCTCLWFCLEGKHLDVGTRWWTINTLYWRSEYC